MKKIPLTKGKFAIVDDENFNYLNQWKWSFNGQYAVRGKFIEYLGRQNGHSKCRYKRVYMHREINKTSNGMETDHINRNKLDNRKNNLRDVTRGQNSRNHDAHKNNITGIVGVNWYKQIKRFRASIGVNKKRIHLGYFLNIQDAIKIRKQAEQKYYAI